MKTNHLARPGKGRALLKAFVAFAVSVKLLTSLAPLHGVAVGLFCLLLVVVACAFLIAAIFEFLS